MKCVAFPRRRELALSVCVCMALTACGGGGGGGTKGGGGSGVVVAPPTTPPPVTPPATPTVDPRLNAHLSLTHADAAHAAGFTGTGFDVTIYDTGVDATNPALTGKIAYQTSIVDSSTNDTSKGDVSGHGTAVAQIIAGSALGDFGGGIAPGSRIRSARIVPDKAPVGLPTSTVTPEMLTNVKNGSSGNLYSRVDVHSWGGADWDTSDTSLTQKWYSSLYGGNALYLFAAGDAGKLDPNNVAALPTLPAYRNTGVWRRWTTVVALDGTDPTKLAADSNQCGATANYCLAAPGSVITLAATSTKDRPVYEVRSGTGIAAAQVGAAAALVLEAFPEMNYDSLRQVLLSTADDLGAPGIDPVFGNGRLNVARAIRGPASIDDELLDLTATGRHSVTFRNDIGGKGALRLQTDADTTIILAGTNTYKGRTSVYGNVESLHGFPADLYAGGRVVTHGDIGGNLFIDRELVTGDTAVRVGKDFWPTPDFGKLTVKLGAPLIVAGTAHLTGDLTIAGAVPGYVPTSHQTVVQAGAIDGAFQTMTLGTGVLLSATLQYTPTEAWLDTRTLSVANVAATTMPQSVAAQSSARRLDGAFARIDRGLADGTIEPSMQNLSMLVAAGNVQQSGSRQLVQRSLESLSGQLYAAGTAVTLAGIDAGDDALIEHLDAQGAAGAWTQSLGTQGSLSRGGFGSVGFSLGGSVVGTDARIGQAGFAGVAIAQMRSSGQLSDNVDRQRNRATEGMFYAGSRGDRWYGVGRFGYGSFRGDMRRLLRFGEQAAFAGSEGTGRYNVVYGETGYRTHAGAFSVTPFASVQFASIRRSGFEESGGAGFGLSSVGQTTSRWQAGFGVRGGATWLTSAGRLRLDGKLAWQGAFATRGEVFSARYTGLAEWAPVEGIGLSRHATTAGMALAWDMDERSQLALDLDQRFADRDRSRSGRLSYRKAW
ncbi:Uncharacterized conserved protein, contains a C-terminal beta-barrel porin domain [Luteibacter sp. 329MFSha]|nr:Uncharacterized conserved protein, contains a C-terminal beta-barrel porin domain [Luteibacter sp. 329MFSha]